MRNFMLRLLCFLLCFQIITTPKLTFAATSEQLYGFKVALKLDQFNGIDENESDFVKVIDLIPEEFNARIAKVTVDGGHPPLILVADTRYTADNGYNLIPKDFLDEWIQFFGKTNKKEYVDFIKTTLDSSKITVTDGKTKSGTFYNFAEVAELCGGQSGEPYTNTDKERHIKNLKTYNSSYQHFLSMTINGKSSLDTLSIQKGETVSIGLTSNEGSYFVTRPQNWTLIINSPGNYYKRYYDSTQKYFSGHSKSETITNSTLGNDGQGNKPFDKPGTYTIEFLVRDNSYHDDYLTGTQNYSVKRSIVVKAPPQTDEPYADATATADPNQIQFNNADIPVNVTIKGELKNYTDVNNIMNWIFYIRKNEETTAQSKPVTSSSLTAQGIFSFTIPSSALNGVESYTQGFTGRARVFFKTPVDGKDYMDAVTQTSTYVYKTAPLPEPDLCGGNIPPIGSMDVPDEAKQGEIIRLEGSGSDPEGNPVTYSWSISNFTQTDKASDSSWVEGYFTTLGPLEVTFKVKDGCGTYRESKTITVTPPTPDARINIGGTLKENRLVTIDFSKSDSPEQYPIDWTKTTYTITAVSGGTNTDIKVSGTSTDRFKNVLLKKAGQYKVSLTVTNTAGYQDTTERNVTIEPDLAPEADFSLISPEYRDPNDNLRATFKITDKSKTTDGDMVQEKYWTFSYNSDNDFGYDGGPRVPGAMPYFEDQTPITVADSNLTTTEKAFVLEGLTVWVYKTADGIAFKVPNTVGQFKFELEVKEAFGQPTLSEFITDADYKKGGTWY